MQKRKTLASIANSNVPLVSKDTMERFLAKDNRVRNSIARKSAEEPLFEALCNHVGSYEKAKIDGKGIDETFRDMLRS
jgi:hypothetical protein